MTTTQKYTTKQRAYVGHFAIRDTKTRKLIHGGGVVAPRPRLYETAEAATEAACNVSQCEPVELV